MPVLQVLHVVILLKLNQILLATLKYSKYVFIGFLMVRWFENKFKDNVNYLITKYIMKEG